MRSILIAIGLLVSATANSATVTIDFNNYTVINNVPGSTIVQSEGFKISAQAWYGGPPDSGVSSNGIWVSAENNFGYCETCGSEINIKRIDDGAFGILSLLDSNTGEYSGVLFGGGYTSLSDPIGTGDWLNLKSFSYSQYDLWDDTYVWIDDVSASVVPIPAAIWLFGSALVGLGWVRRKQTD
jgi:hypothetical protein